jgi:hypothetical protein
VADALDIAAGSNSASQRVAANDDVEQTFARGNGSRLSSVQRTQGRYPRKFFASLSEKIKARI